MEKRLKYSKKNPNISVAFIGETKTPENYTKDELDQIAVDPSKAALLISSVFTTEYESAIVKGKVKLVEDGEEKKSRP